MRLVLALLLAWSLPALATDTFIVPGVRVGPAVLGQSLEELTRLLGAGQPQHSPQYTNIIYPGFTVVVGNQGRPSILSVVVTDPPYHLKNGLGIGSQSKLVM
ncbi:MAG TPA: hypothetical protein VGO93_09165, partial [Candidatus Xenobia bacterium]